ncbi:hypothetical protein SAMN05428944_0232 [Streptomyces sp. 1222.5]|nr:hypothetical protein BX260_7861 [Streptomyces sp. 5112.2]SEB55426.1 hypothetical protein SAMN05428944_0232 [Streptomyces sp. 1222.5]
MAAAGTLVVAVILPRGRVLTEAVPAQAEHGETPLIADQA